MAGASKPANVSVYV
jgi:hypothetical protein